MIVAAAKCERCGEGSVVNWCDYCHTRLCDACMKSSCTCGRSPVPDGRMADAWWKAEIKRRAYVRRLRRESCWLWRVLDP